MDIYREIVRLQESQTPAALVTIIDCIGSTPRKMGSKMIVKSDETIVGTVGGGAVEKQIIADALEVIRSNKIMRSKYDLTSDLGMCCGGSMEVLIEPVSSKLKLIVFGAGHTGKALQRLGRFLDFHVTVVDERPEFANQENLPDAHKIISKFHKLAFEELTFDYQTYITVVTHDHQYDKEILLHCAKQDWVYLGMIGSERKAAIALDYLREKGIGDEIIRKIHTPMGLQIGAQSPEEIAVSIFSEMIAVQKGVQPSLQEMKWEGTSKKKVLRA